MEPDDTDVPRLVALADLTPTFSVTVLYCHPDADPPAAFRSLVGFLRSTLDIRGRAQSVKRLGEIALGESDRVEGVDSLLELGIDDFPSAILRGTFRGDGKTVWLRGVHRRRANKADSKTLGGICVQELLGEEDAIRCRASRGAVLPVGGSRDRPQQGQGCLRPQRRRA